MMHSTTADAKYIETDFFSSVVPDKYSYSDLIETRGIPFNLVENLFSYLEYGSLLSVAIKLLHETGCRISELNKIERQHLQGRFLRWRCGKNQGGKWRKAIISEGLIKELEVHVKTHKVPSNVFIESKGSSISRRFNKEIRPLLCLEWRELNEFPKTNLRKDYEYKYQLKGFRKNYATIFFYYWYKRMNNDPILPLQLTCATMGHSSKYITSDHYLLCAFQIRVEKFIGMMVFEIVPSIPQKRLYDF